MDKNDSGPPHRATPFDRFQDFTRRLLAVPKKEIDEKEREWREARPRKKDAKTRGKDKLTP